MDARDRERLDRVNRRVDEMVRNPFGRQVLRDLVPRGSVITPALAEEPLGQAVRRAIGDSGGTPAFLAIDELSSDAPTLLVITRGDGGRLSLGRPGDWRGLDWVPGRDHTLGEVIAAIRAAHGEDA